VVEDPSAAVDLEILVEDSPGEADAVPENAGTVLKITKRRKRGAEGSIYRYDRDALVAALDNAQTGEAA